MNQFVKEPDTEVYHGFETTVTLWDLRMEIKMDPVPGNWKDGKWAREQALQAMAKELSSPETAVATMRLLMEAYFQLGVKKGKSTIQHELRELLGVYSKEDVVNFSCSFEDNP